MTKSTITREQLLEIIETDHVQCGEASYLARMALAAMAGEPVAWTWHYREQWHVTNDERRAEFVAKDGDVSVLPLYRHAQPAPVVPDELPVHAIAPYSGAEYEAGYRDGWNACRAAMLAAAPQSPGSEPTTVPGTWIPVNERLPEAGGGMIVFTDGIVMSGVSYAKKKGFYIQALEYDDDEPVDSVTHWMPLPAAPQEEKGE
ncbi:DUF551 domain-containing protein [Klebsiella pneumoniae]|uniref:DUF551 domain-containing protein n=1 Tax=Klebsiella pneumoniae TaxID=573 RepID=UPI0023618557|nr:DUF551 domain-containing protein [Klebsiella pneumoniae]WDA32572.1 DUF551 domain-containing protein [Klebsiella pneumoniae]